MKLLLKEWKAQLYQEADRERLAKLAQLGDEDAAAELQRQDSRKGELLPEEIVKRIIQSNGAELATYKNSNLLDVDPKIDKNENGIFGIKTAMLFNDETYIVIINKNGDHWNFYASAKESSPQGYNYYARIYNGSFIAEDWQIALDRAIKYLKQKIDFNRAEDNYLDRE